MRVSRWFRFLPITLIAATQAFSHPYYVGYSNAPGSFGSCAATCHGTMTGGTVTVTGFPSAYTPGQSYTVHVGHNGGDIIANFNASCRVGTDTANVGTLSAGNGTETYYSILEPMGVHMTSAFHDSATFVWTAPAAGRGQVDLYVSSHQTTSPDGANNIIMQISEETTSPPAAASNPSPANGATNVSLTPTLSWSAGAGATSHDVYFGSTNPPPFRGNQAGTSYNPASMGPGMVYYWRIDERNFIGATPGPLWNFSSMTGMVPVPQFATIMADQTAIQLRWYRVTGATGYRVYRATTADVQPIAANLIGSPTDTLYVDATGPSQNPKAFYVVTAVLP